MRIQGYAPEDFVLFDPGIYYAMVAGMHDQIWLWRIAAMGLGLSLIWALWKGGRATALAWAIVGLGWIVVGYVFFVRWFASIQIGAEFVGFAFMAQGVLLIMAGALANRLPLARTGFSYYLGLVIVVAAVIFYPIVSGAMRASFAEAELFAVMPNPTVLATFGLLIAARGLQRFAYMLIPLIWAVLAVALAVALRL